jgi:hypothetical protein
VARFLIVVVLSWLVAGCGGVGGVYLVSHKIIWNRLGLPTTQQQADADWYECQRANLDPITGTMTIFEEKMAKQCMAARGYTWHDSGF